MRPRSEQVDQSVVGTYHCISRCVRRASLLSAGKQILPARKPWIESRLRHLVSIFAVELDTFTLMDNHMHLVLTIRPDIVAGWSDEEVAKRWLTYLPPVTRGVRRTATEEDIRKLQRDPAKIAKCRLRLCELGEFHKALKQPLARLVNIQENVTGHFWEGRYRSRRVLDLAALLSTMAYVDLNPVRASIARTPEQSPFTGMYHRASARDHVLRRMSRRERARLQTAAKRLDGWRRGCVAFPSEPVPSFLTPIAHTEERRGLFGDMTLDEYLVVVDRIGREVRRNQQDRRGRIPHDLAPILERIEVDGKSFLAQMASTAKWFGSVIGLEASCALESARVGRTRVVSALRLDREKPGRGRAAGSRSKQDRAKVQR